MHYYTKLSLAELTTMKISDMLLLRSGALCHIYASVNVIRYSVCECAYTEKIELEQRC